MAENEKQGVRGIRRTALEVKRYRTLMRFLPTLAAFLAMILIILYIVTILYNKYGSFTVMVNKFDSIQYGLSLSETPEFYSPTVRLNAKANEEVTNISAKDLPDNLDSINGEHNGANYVAYTYYLKNVGIETINCQYELYIANMTLQIEEAVRVRLYVNGVMTDYAKTRTDGGGAEAGTTEFLTETVITRNTIMNFKPEDITKFTVVIWLEGDDPECIDNILGGQFKIDMTISILGVDNESESESK